MAGGAAPGRTPRGPGTPGPRARPAARRARLPAGTSGPRLERGRAGSATPAVESRPPAPPRGARREPREARGPRAARPAYPRRLQRTAALPLWLSRRCAPAAGAPECPRRGGVPGPRPSPPRPPARPARCTRAQDGCGGARAPGRRPPPARPRGQGDPGGASPHPPRRPCGVETTSPPRRPSPRPWRRTLPNLVQVPIAHGGRETPAPQRTEGNREKINLEARQPRGRGMLGARVGPPRAQVMPLPLRGVRGRALSTRGPRRPRSGKDTALWTPCRRTLWL